MDKESTSHTLLFAGTICIVCSLLLSGATALLKKQQDLQVELDRRINVLKAFGTPVTDARGRKISAAEVDRIFAEHISELVLDAQTGKPIPDLTSADVSRDELEQKVRLPLYVWKDGGKPAKYAFPISGKGLWSTIYGYLALDKDLGTIVGATFFRHGETPGLGGEVSSDWFQKQFAGKKVFADGRLLGFEVVKGPVRNKYPGGSDHAVDGISGATMTGNGINVFLNRDLERYEKYFRSIRKG